MCTLITTNFRNSGTDAFDNGKEKTKQMEKELTCKICCSIVQSLTPNKARKGGFRE